MGEGEELKMLGSPKCDTDYHSCPTCHRGKRRTAVVRICEDLLKGCLDFFKKPHDPDPDPEELMNDPDFLALCERIQGKVVTVKFIGPDAFEAEDDNYWIPETCWEPIDEYNPYIKKVDPQPEEGVKNELLVHN